MKRMIIFIMSLILLISLAGCIRQPRSEFVIGYSTPSLQNPFWIFVSEGMQNKAIELEVDLRIYDAGNDIGKQAGDIEDLIEQRVDVLLITPYDSYSLAPTIKLANEAEIPVIIVDIGIKDSEYDSLIITDNYTGGKMAGEWLVEYLEQNEIENPIVATIEAQLGAENASMRHQGFIDIMDQNNIELVLESSANSKRDQAMVVMEDYLQAYPQLTAVFVESDIMALGALQAVEQADADTVIIGYDGILSTCVRLQEGSNLKAVIGQKPNEIGMIAVEMATKLIQGELIDKLIEIEPVLITDENVDEYIETFLEK